MCRNKRKNVLLQTTQTQRARVRGVEETIRKKKEENYQKLLSKSNKYIHNLVDENVQDISNLGRQLDQLKAKNEELKAKIKYMEEYIKTVENTRNEFEKESKFLKGENKRLKQILAEIKEIAEGMHDLWINKTPYTDINNLVKHILECELNRIRYKLDEISECEVENAR